MGTGGVHAQMGAVAVVSGTLVDIIALLPVRSQNKAFGAHTEHLVVAVNALMRTASIVDRAPSNRLTSVIIGSNSRPWKIFTRALVAAFAVSASILARSMAVVQQALVHIETVALIGAAKGTVAWSTLADEGAGTVHADLATAS